MASRIEILNQLIKKQGLDWVAIDTGVSHLPDSEKKLICGVSAVEGAQGLIDHDHLVSGKERCLKEITTPLYYDWDNLEGASFVTPGRLGLKSQGMTSACPAFGTIAAIEACQSIESFRKEHHLDKSIYESNVDLNPTHTIISTIRNERDLSETDLWYKNCYTGGSSCANAGNCPRFTNGGSVVEALVQAVKDGVLPESCWEWSWDRARNYCMGYSSQQGLMGIGQPTCDRNSAQYITDYRILDSIDDTKVLRDLIRRWITLCGPVVAIMDVYDSFFYYGVESNSWSRLRKGDWHVYSELENERFIGRHAVCIVGYGSKRSLQYWIIKNSLGADRANTGEPWGYNSFALIDVESGSIGGISAQTNHPSNLVYGICAEGKVKKLSKT